MASDLHLRDPESVPDLRPTGKPSRDAGAGGRFRLRNQRQSQRFGWSTSRLACASCMHDHAGQESDRPFAESSSNDDPPYVAATDHRRSLGSHLRNPRPLRGVPAVQILPILNYTLSWRAPWVFESFCVATQILNYPLAFAQPQQEKTDEISGLAPCRSRNAVSGLAH